MAQPTSTETVGAFAEQHNTDQDETADAFRQVLDDVAALSPNPARDQSPPGGAGSGHKGHTLTGLLAKPVASQFASAS